jgi:hypothetical protein
MRVCELITDRLFRQLADSAVEVVPTGIEPVSKV